MTFPAWLSARDITDTELFREAEALQLQWRRPGTGAISDAAEINVEPRGRWAAFAGVILERLEGAPETRICECDLDTGEFRTLTAGPGRDRLPKYSRDGETIAFLSDAAEAGDFQLCFLDRRSGQVRAAPRVDGWVEYFHWSPAGDRILLGVAGREVDLAGIQGATGGQASDATVPAWAPVLSPGDDGSRRRRAVVLDVTSGALQEVRDDGANIWDAAWCGEGAVAAVASQGVTEGDWYGADLRLLDLGGGPVRLLHRAQAQLGWLSCAPDGSAVAVVEATASDRYLVCGDLLLLDPHSGSVRTMETGGVDVAYAEWRVSDELLVAGHRGFETHVATWRTDGEGFRQVWSSRSLSTGGAYATVSGFGRGGDCVLVGEGFFTPPEIAVIRSGAYHRIRSLAETPAAFAADREVEEVVWRGADGDEVQGWLLRPASPPPYATVMNVHGGPVWHWRPRWLNRFVGLQDLLLLDHRYAVFLPNPRGSTGRGRTFAAQVVGDMGGRDALDLLAGVDALVSRGVADPARLGVTGGSYGGYMTYWLITQDRRFAAAVAVSPISNPVTEELASNVPHFIRTFLGGAYADAGGRYFSRSPLMHAPAVATPTLSVCGALDRVTPAVEALQFHNALQAQGVASVLATYPGEGHGVRSWPALSDYAVRLVGWFEAHMKPV